MRKKIGFWACGLLLAVGLMACGPQSAEESVGETQAITAESVVTESTDSQQESAAESAENEAKETESEETETEGIESETCPLEDGTYIARFDTDSSMFHVNEAYDGQGSLTVEDGKMTIHITLVSKTILNLFSGLAEDAQKEGAVLLEPTVDEVTYSDGYTEEVYGFDVPVPYLDKEFDLALIGKKGKWYDHKVSVSQVEKKEAAPETMVLFNGEYDAEVTLQGGSGKATVESPVKILVKDGKAFAVLVWSSKNYDYMIVEGEKYLNEAAEGQPSVFTIPVRVFGEDLPVIADTVAMSTPHEIEYTLHFELMK